MKLLEIVRQHIPCLLIKAYFWKDGCTAQFRFRFTFDSMTFYPNELELSWDYCESHHFKGSYDGIGLAKCSKPTRPNRPIVYRAYVEDELLCPVKWVYTWHTGTRDAVIQISCPLAHFQMFFASFLQNIEMSSFFVYGCNCSCIIRLSNMCSEPGFIFVESFQAERSRFSRDFMWHLFSIQFHLFLSLDLRVSSLLNLHQKKL